MRTLLVVMALSASLIATPGDAQTAVDLPILRTPSRTPACTAMQGRIGSDQVLITGLTFTLRGNRDRDIDLMVDSTDRVIFLVDRESHASVGDTARSTAVTVNLLESTPSGTVALLRIDKEAVRRQLLENNFRLPPMTDEERARVVGTPRPLTAEEIERARSLGSWLLARRCAVGSR